MQLKMREVEAITGFRLHRFSLSEFQKLIELNFFAENTRVELLDGLIMEMNSITPPHADCVDHLLEIFHALLGKKSSVCAQCPVVLDRRASQLQPDVTVAIRRPEGYADRHMDAQEILLLIEVADSSLHGDRTDKLDIYASEGIKEYWIVNLVDNQLEIHQEPYLSATGEGTYKIKRTYVCDETISPQAFPECQIALNKILPRGS